MSTLDGGRKIALEEKNIPFLKLALPLQYSNLVRNLPIVDFLVSEDVTYEPDAGDEVHEDGKESEAVPSRLPRHL